MSREKQAQALAKDWAENPRWQGIKRGYTAEDVVRLRGSVQTEQTLARGAAERLWRSLAEAPYVNSLGAVMGKQAMQMAKAGLKAVYLSGRQGATDANNAGDMYPNQSRSPAGSSSSIPPPTGFTEEAQCEDSARGADVARAGTAAVVVRGPIRTRGTPDETIQREHLDPVCPSCKQGFPAAYRLLARRAGSRLQAPMQCGTATKWSEKHLTWCCDAPETLAHLIDPHDEAVRDLNQWVREEARRRTGQTVWNLRRAGSPGVRLIAEVVYDCLVRCRIDYAPEPRSYAPRDQVVRSPGRVLNDREGTCLDIAKFLADLFESLHLGALLTVLRGGMDAFDEFEVWHAYAGVRLQSSDSACTVVRDASRVADWVADGEILLLDPNGLAWDGELYPMAVSFEESIARAERDLYLAVLGKAGAGFEFAVDVSAGRAAPGDVS